MTDLGHQTAQRIVHASDPLQSMQEINQNFPSVVSSLSRMKVNYPKDTWVRMNHGVTVNTWKFTYCINFVICCSDENVLMFMQLNDSVKDEIIANQRMIPPGKCLMGLNGALVNIEDIDLYV